MCVIIFWWRIRRERLLNFGQRDLLQIVKFLVRHTSGSKTPATNHSKIAIAVVFFFTKRTAVLVYKQRQGAEKQWVFWVLHLLTFLSIRLIPDTRFLLCARCMQRFLAKKRNHSVETRLKTLSHSVGNHRWTTEASRSQATLSRYARLALRYGESMLHRYKYPRYVLENVH